ncbi:hypothetical protein JTB14_020372 [Gonioctena quinquepunctata]|nr:hypothetical protein JTB14_020372 [Gonioctena quinquepunctata]
MSLLSYSNSYRRHHTLSAERIHANKGRKLRRIIPGVTVAFPRLEKSRQVMRWVMYLRLGEEPNWSSTGRKYYTQVKTFRLITNYIQEALEKLQEEKVGRILGQEEVGHEAATYPFT